MTDTITSITRRAVSKPSLKELKRSALRTADRASKILPKILDRIEDRVEAMEDKQLVSAGHLLAGLTQHRAQVAKAAGLLKSQQDAPQKANTIINVNNYGDLPISERIKLIQAEVSGVPFVLPSQVPGVELPTRKAEFFVVPPLSPPLEEPAPSGEPGPEVLEAAQGSPELPGSSVPSQTDSESTPTPENGSDRVLDALERQKLEDRADEF